MFSLVEEMGAKVTKQGAPPSSGNMRQKMGHNAARGMEMDPGTCAFLGNVSKLDVIGC